MTSTPRNQPHIPQLQIDLDEILATIALDSREYESATSASRPFPA